MDCGARPNPGCMHTFSCLRIVYSAYSDVPSRWRRNSCTQRLPHSRAARPHVGEACKPSLQLAPQMFPNDGLMRLALI